MEGDTAKGQSFAAKGMNLRETEMKELKTILTVLDRSNRDERVIARALQLRRHFGARVELFLCDAEHEYAFRQNYDDRRNAEGRKLCVADAVAYLNSVRETFGTADEDTSVTVSACCDSPLYQGVLNKVRQLQPDLVLKSPDCERADCGIAFSDNDWQLASTCPCPVMFVGTRTWDEAPKILAAVDASLQERPGLARAILEIAEAVRRKLNGRLEVVACAADPAREFDVHSYSRRLDHLLSDVYPEKEHVHLLKGEPESVLPEFARSRRYDIFVMGALAHRTGLAPVVGSLTSKLVSVLDCDFILIKAEKLSLREKTASPDVRAGAPS
jgi:nucleotide-binding universal stress UspA family protein